MDACGQKLVVQPGIWKPAALDAALTVRTTFTAPNQLPPYVDAIAPGGLVKYAYRGTDPNHSDNRALRTAMLQQRPLAYFIGVGKSVYRMPGCHRRPGRHDIDHGRPYAAGGPTACWNLCCLCRRHHRIKTFARGWSFTLLPDGRLVVRTPSGISRTTRPPGWCHDPEPDPPWLDDLAPPDPLRT